MLTAGKWKIDLASPHQIYKNAANKRLPGVTTILGVFDKPALRRWGLGMERDRIFDALRDELDRFPANAEDPSRQFTLAMLSALPPNNDKGDPTYFSEVFTERAANIGTVTHARCEAFLHGVELDEEGLDAELVDKSMNGFIRFHDWWTANRLAVVHSELQMVSESMQVGGTADIVARKPGGMLWLIDLKTSKPSRYWPFNEVFGQVGAYAEMYEETQGEKIGQVHVWRIGKEDNDPGQVYCLSDRERETGMRLFRAGLEAYNAKKELSRG